ncbi:MAG: hypothetical protein ACP5T0_07620 [Verrucomicrobiia bacterium]
MKCQIQCRRPATQDYRTPKDIFLMCVRKFSGVRAATPPLCG